jgi:hypothetical protein
MTDGVNVAYRKIVPAILPDIDADSILMLDKELITDGKKVFFQHWLLEGIDPEEVKLNYQNNALVSVQDDNTKYSIIVEYGGRAPVIESLDDN